MKRKKKIMWSVWGKGEKLDKNKKIWTMKIMTTNKTMKKTLNKTKITLTKNSMKMTLKTPNPAKSYDQLP